MVKKREDQIETRIKKLQKAYAKELPALLKRIEGFFGRVVSSKGQDREALSEVYRLVHSIRGSGPSFGFHRLSEIAHGLEMLIDHALKTPEAWQETLAADAAELLKQMRKVPLESQVEPEVETSVQPAPMIKPKVGKASQRNPIAWIGSNPDDSHQIRSWLKLFGIATVFFAHPDMILKQGKKFKTDAFIIDGSNEKTGLQPWETNLKKLKSEYKRVPIVFLLSPDLELPQLIAAYENGADACFTLPIDFFALVTKLDQVIAPEGEGPFRLLIVEDDVVLADHIATILRKAGLEVAVLNDPLGIELILESFHPELILMDLYLGPCSGNALAKLIRQKEPYMNIPIVYISTETELAKRLEAFEVGADDFLLKPVKYHYLYYTLYSRMKRSRLLGVNLTRDSLTGLLDHSSIRQKLANAIAEAVASKEPLTFALIDLDDIGQVNLQLGSEGGDRVLKTLAKLLDMNVRDMGWAGRYGGKEFSLILPKMDEAKARAFFEPLREGFAEIIHGRQGKEPGLKASFSAGLVSTDLIESPAKIAAFALRALRSAQMKGGNSLVFIEVASQLNIAPQAQQELPAIEVEDDDELVFFLDDEDSSIPLVDSKSLADKTGLGLKIVIVDDEKQILYWLEAQMKELGYQVWTALSGDDGYDLVLKHKPDVLLTDLLLFPGIHGFELCHKVKLNPDLASVVIVVMTAVYRDDRYRREATDAGAEAFITKPIEMAVLQASIKELVNADK